MTRKDNTRRAANVAHMANTVANTIRQRQQSLRHMAKTLQGINQLAPHTMTDTDWEEKEYDRIRHQAAGMVMHGIAHQTDSLLRELNAVMDAYSQDDDEIEEFTE